MKIKQEKIWALIRQLEVVISKLKAAESIHSKEFEFVHPAFKEGAKNLIHYRTFRSMNLNKLQKRLSNFGLTILASTESHVMATLVNSRQILLALLHEKDGYSPPKRTTIKSSINQQKKHAKDLFGYRSKGRRVRIMVTLPTQAAYDYDLVHNLVATGMNTARINCAHDTPEIWKMMIMNLNRAKKALHKNCKVFMDLAGPKIRTGQLEKGASILKFKPKRNEFGEVTDSATIELVANDIVKSKTEIPVDQEWLSSIKTGDTIKFKDTRNKSRKLFIKSISDNRAIASCQKTFYIRTGTLLTSISTLEQSKVGEIPPREQSILLKKGDYLKLLKNNRTNKSLGSNDQTQSKEIASISCTSKAVFDSVLAGERVLFDDGKITGIIKENLNDEILIEILKAKTNGTKLKGDKGINFPDSELHVGGLSEKDKVDLKFLVQYADGVNASFINSATDVEELYSELELLDVKENFGVVLKIENQRAYQNLNEILLIAMQRYPIGVMIARGDLAIETGWENLPRIQNEILRLCDSAFVPTIWATQVLENLAKNGIPSRSELTDVASSLKADCVMLNKGPHILDAVKLLNQILTSMNSYRDKDVRMFEAMPT